MKGLRLVVGENVEAQAVNCCLRREVLPRSGYVVEVPLVCFYAASG